MRLLVVEDDESLCRAVGFQLDKEGYEYDMCHNGKDALYYIEKYSHDLILLDRMLPELDGLTILQKIRKKNIEIPVIMVTALNGVHDRVDGLDSGADDYLVKPYDMEELLARIRALLRRPRKIEAVDNLSYGDITLDKMASVLKNGELFINLSKREAMLMEFFILNYERTLTRDQILSRIWGDSFVEDGNIDTYVCFLRKRLKQVKSETVIKNVYGVGYRMEKNK